MKKKIALSVSAALVAALCIPAIAFAIGGTQSDEMELEKTAAQTTRVIEVEEESMPAQSGTVEEVGSDEQSVAIDATEPETQATTQARGYNFVDDDGDGVCDNFGNSDCAGVGNCVGNGNGVCNGTGARNGSGVGNSNGVCDGSGVDGARGFGNRGDNGQGAADRSCDGTGRGANQGGHYGNGNQRR